MSRYLNGHLISGAQTLVGKSYNIGQIIPSLVPLKDASLHLIDGTLIRGNGAYSAFVTEMSKLVPTYPNLFVTEEDWQASVATYGVCGKFVHSVDSISSTITVASTTMTLQGTRNASSDMDAGSLGMRYAWYVPQLNGDIFTTSTSPVVGDDIWIYENGTWSTTYMGIEPKIDAITENIRLPKITGKIEGTTNVNALGDLEEQYIKLPNITGYFSMKEHHGALVGMASEGGAIYGSDYGNYTRPDGGADTGSGANRTVNINASRSSSVYSGNGTDTKIHEQAVNILYYIVIATSTKTDIQVDIDEVVTDLNGKADVDLTNCTKPYVIETYRNGASWYRKWSDGFCEQGGFITGNGAYGVITVSLLVPFIDTNYVIYGTQIAWGNSTWYTGTFTTTGNGVTDVTGSTQNKTTTNFQTQSASNRFWMASGYIS